MSLNPNVGDLLFIAKKCNVEPKYPIYCRSRYMFYKIISSNHLVPSQFCSRVYLTEKEKFCLLKMHLSEEAIM